MSQIQRFGMQTRNSPLAMENATVVQSLNGTLDGEGRLVKRYGFSVVVTPDLVVGSAAPYRFFRWYGAAANYLVQCGSNALAFVNPLNKYLYVRTASTALIYSDPSTQVSASWGLAAVSGTPTTSNDGAVHGLMAGGAYAYNLTAYDTARNVEGPPRAWLTTTTEGCETSLLQPVPGPGWTVPFTACTLPAGADRLRTYRVQKTHLSKNTAWQSIPTGKALEDARLISEQAAAPGSVTPTRDRGYADAGMRMNYANTVVPFCQLAAFYDGRWFYAVRGGSVVYYSVPACPETYAETITVDDVTYTPTVGETGDGRRIAGRATIMLPPDAGPITGLVAYGDTLLILCRWGCWPVVRLSDGASYGRAPLPFWTGCASSATIAASPVGVFWLSDDAVVLWRGGEAPQSVTRELIDPASAITPFAADVSGACGCYDFAKGRYVVAIPKPTSGWFMLCIEAGRLDSRDFVTQWAIRDATAAVTGMGYDPTNKRIVLGANAGVWGQSASVYTDQIGTDVGAPVFSVDVYWHGFYGAPIRQSPGVWIYCHRASVASAQSIAWTIAGLPGTESAGGTAASGTITMPASTYKAYQIAPQAVAGRLIRVTLSNQDAGPLELRMLSIGEGDDVSARHNKAG